MLEILLLISFTRKIAVIAEQKGLKPGTWKLYVVLAWIGAEVLGAIIGVMMFGAENYAFIFPMYGCALGSYFLLRHNLKQKPDPVGDWISQIGEPETDELPAGQQ